MRLLQYNILDGCRELSRSERLDQWMAEQSYDVIGLNEMNEWTAEEFEQRASKWGYPYTRLLVTSISKYHMGIAAKTPIDYVTHAEAPYHHGMLHVKIKGIHFLLTHMSPMDSLRREQEAAAIAMRIADLDEPVVVMGDLNSLSPGDRGRYEQVELVQRFRTNERQTRAHLVDGHINYRPIELLLEAGLSDTANTGDAFELSLPTHINGIPGPKAGVRLDYILVNSKLQQHRPQSRVLRSTELDTLSDHYPVECWWTS